MPDLTMVINRMPDAPLHHEVRMLNAAEPQPRTRPCTRRGGFRRGWCVAMTHDGGVDYRGNSWSAVPSPLLFAIASTVLTAA